MNSTNLAASDTGLETLRGRALLLGGIGLVACAAGWWLNPLRFYQAYLTAWLFWSGLAVGSLALLMLQHLTGGAWGLMIRRPLEACLRTLPLLALFFVPLLFGLADLYPWARPEEVAASDMLRHKAPYLNISFFVVRTALYLAIWTGLGWFLNRCSARQDAEGNDAGIMARFRVASGPGLVLLALTMTFASVDWIMSLEPHWYSTMFGALVLVGHVVGGLAFSIALVVALADVQPLASILQPRHFHDLGKLLLALVMVWAYFAFSQFLIIWAGNLPEEIPWYLSRLNGGWQWAALALLLFHFVVPFLMLLSRKLKRDPRRLGRVALLVLVMHLVDVYWLVNPAHGRSLADFHWLDVATLLGLGGIWLAVFVTQLRSRPLLPFNDPYLQEAMRHARH